MKFESHVAEEVFEIDWYFVVVQSERWCIAGNEESKASLSIRPFSWGFLFVSCPYKLEVYYSQAVFVKERERGNLSKYKRYVCNLCNQVCDGIRYRYKFIIMRYNDCLIINKAEKQDGANTVLYDEGNFDEMFHSTDIIIQSVFGKALLWSKEYSHK